MHPYTEILFSLILAFSGALLIKKMATLKKIRKSASKYPATKKYVQQLSQKLFLRFMVSLFALIFILSVALLIENKLISISW